MRFAKETFRCRRAPFRKLHGPSKPQRKKTHRLSADVAFLEGDLDDKPWQSKWVGGYGCMLKDTVEKSQRDGDKFAGRVACL